MSKLIGIATVVLVLFTIATTVQAIRDLNDGRVLTVVKQLTTPQVLNANASNLKRTK